MKVIIKYQFFFLIEKDIATGLNVLILNLTNTSLNPIQLQTPIYGKTSFTFVDFLAPGMVTLIIFAQSLGLASITFVREKVDGCIDRIWATGASPISMVIGTFCTHSLITICQTTLLLIVAIFGFRVTLVSGVAGAFQLAFMLISLALVGMSLGLLFSVIANQEVEAVQLAIGIYFPTLLLSGVLWPLQGIPDWFVWISYGLPTTWAADASRSIMLRGWNINMEGVWLGYVATASWAIFLLIIATLALQPASGQWHLKQKLLACCGFRSNQKKSKKDIETSGLRSR